MTIFENTSLIINFLLVIVFPLTLWIAALVLCIKSVSISSALKKYLMSGVILNISAVLIMIPGRYLAVFLYPEIWDLDMLILFNTVLQGAATVIGAAGLFLVLWGFWKLFKERYDEKTVTAKPD